VQSRRPTHHPASVERSLKVHQVVAWFVILIDREIAGEVFSPRFQNYDLQTQVTLRSSQRRARPAIANQDLTYSTFWNPVSIVTLVPVTLPCK
jgi:hypothetical protein